MPTSVPGSRRPAGAVATAGFTLLELLIVVAVIALGTGLSILALRDSSRNQLEQEAARLSALLDVARVESRVSGVAITWRPLARGSAPGAGAVNPTARRDFIFEPPLWPSPRMGSGNAPAPRPDAWPTTWLHEKTQAEVITADRLVLGPEPLIPAQRVRLRLGEQQLTLTTDGLSPFRVEQAR